MQKLTRISMERFLEAQATDARILDIGSGDSVYKRYFPNRVTVDVDPARNPDVVGSIYDLPFPNSSFGIILCTEVLEHLNEPAKAIAELERVIEPGGKLILTTRFLAPPHDTPHDYFRFTEFGLQYLLRNWSDVTVTPDLTTMETLGTFFQRLMFQTDVRGGRFTKLIFLFLAWLSASCSWLIIREYGDIKKTTPFKGLLVSGYQVIAHK